MALLFSSQALRAGAVPNLCVGASWSRPKRGKEREKKERDLEGVLWHALQERHRLSMWTSGSLPECTQSALLGDRLPWGWWRMTPGRVGGGVRLASTLLVGMNSVRNSSIVLSFLLPQHLWCHPQSQGGAISTCGFTACSKHTQTCDHHYEHGCQETGGVRCRRLALLPGDGGSDLEGDLGLPGGWRRQWDEGWCC